MVNSIENQLTTVEEKNALKRLTSEMRNLEKETQSVEDRIEAIRDAIDARAEDYIEENYEEFLTTRITTANKLVVFLAKYGRIRILGTERSYYKYLLAKSKYTSALVTEFNRVFWRDIANGYINARQVPDTIRVKTVRLSPAVNAGETILANREFSDAKEALQYVKSQNVERSAGTEVRVYGPDGFKMTMPALIKRVRVA